MSAADLISLTIGFMAPLPPEWRERDERPAFPRANGWILGPLAGLTLLMWAAPFCFAWAAHLQYDAFRTRCDAAHGRLTHLPSNDGRPYRCDPR